MKIKTRTLSFGSICFVTDFTENNEIVRIEKHDMRFGSNIKIPQDRDSRTFFIETVFECTKSAEHHSKLFEFLAEGYNGDENDNPLKKGIIAAIEDTYGVAADADTYKWSHGPQMPKGFTKMVSYIESRGGKFDKVLFFGLQLILLEYFTRKVTSKHIPNMVEFGTEHFGGNFAKDLEVALQTVVDEYDGRLPIRIRAAKEGLLIPVKNVLVVVESLVEDPRVAVLVSFFETKLMRLWSPTTVATTSWHIREIIYKGLVESADNPDAEIPFKLHDFGSRGVGGMEVAAFAGAGHLATFQGSDTSVGVMAANLGYNSKMAGYSIPASEHSTTTAHGLDNEIQLVEQMFDEYAKEGALFATVIDSKNWINFVENIAPLFKERLIKSGATWVFRPDSGDPVETPIEVVRRLAKVFGYEVNSKGYKVLKHVRVLQGDGIDINDVAAIIDGLLADGWSLSNMAFGMGGGLLQKNNRDTQKFAMKCCAILVDGEWQEVYKEPAVFTPGTWELDESASSFKKSKRGRLELLFNRQTGEYLTTTEEDAQSLIGQFGWESALFTVYEHGKLIKPITLDEVRKNAGC